MSFSTSAEVDIVLEDRSVRAARQQLESELGSVPVGTADGGTTGAQAAGGTGNGRARRRARREHRWARERTDHAEQAVVYLEEIEDHLDEGALGGGGGGLVNTLIGSATETAGDAAVEAGDTALDLGTEAIGTAIGNSVSNAVSGESISVDDPSPLEVKDPSPLGVDDPSPLEVEDPSPLGVDDPSPLEVKDPSPLGVDDPSPLEVEDVGAIPVDAPESIPVELRINMSGGEGGASQQSQDGGYGPLKWWEIPFAGAGPTAAKRTGAGSDASRGINSLLESVPVVGDGLANANRQSADWVAERSPYVDEPAYKREGLITDSPPQQRDGAQSTSTTSRIETVTYDNDVSVTIDVDSDVHYDELDRLEDDIMSQTEDHVADAIDELRRDIERSGR